MPESSMTEVLKSYESKGFRGQFAVHGGGVVRCGSCRSARSASSLEMDALHRLEGDSDPEAEAVVIALHCPSCGTGGTMVLSYGPEASIEDQQVLQQIGDARARSPIMTGA